MYSIPEFSFKHPFACMLAGPSQSGKSTLLAKILENTQNMITPPPNKIVYCYSRWSDGFNKLKLLTPRIDFQEGLPDIDCNKCTNNNNKDNNNYTTTHTINNVHSPLQGHHAFHTHIHQHAFPHACIHITMRPSHMCFVVVHQHSNNTNNTFSSNALKHSQHTTTRFPQTLVNPTRFPQTLFNTTRFPQTLFNTTRFPQTFFNTTRFPQTFFYIFVHINMLFCHVESGHSFRSIYIYLDLNAINTHTHTTTTRRLLSLSPSIRPPSHWRSEQDRHTSTTRRDEPASNTINHSSTTSGTPE